MSTTEPAFLPAPAPREGPRLWQRVRRVLGDKRELARLNHIFIPAKKADRDRFRNGRFAKLLRPVFSLYFALSQEGRALFVMTILVGLASLDIHESQVYLLFAMLVGLVTASVASRLFFRAHGLSLRVEGPARVAVGETQRFVVTLENRGNEPLASLRLVAPFLPWDGKWLRSPDPVAAIRPQGRASVLADATFMARGEHHLDAFEAALLVPMGLALGPRRQSNDTRFLVVPRVPSVGPIRVTHRRAQHRDARVTSRAVGDDEFAGVRPYRAGDSLKHLHARTWARTGVPHVRTYVAERSDRVGIVVWVDGDDAKESTKEAALTLAAGVAARLLAQGEGVDRLVIDSEVFVVAPRSGRAALDAVLDRLAVFATTTNEVDIEPTLSEAASSLSSLVLIAADDSPRRRRLLAELERVGIPLRWVVVGEDGGEGERPVRVSQAEIEGAGVIRV